MSKSLLPDKQWTLKIRISSQLNTGGIPPWAKVKPWGWSNQLQNVWPCRWDLGGVNLDLATKIFWELFVDGCSWWWIMILIILCRLCCGSLWSTRSKWPAFWLSLSIGLRRDKMSLSTRLRRDKVYWKVSKVILAWMVEQIMLTHSNQQFQSWFSTFPLQCLWMLTGCSVCWMRL